jgi:hypothetical protein
VDFSLRIIIYHGCITESRTLKKEKEKEKETNKQMQMFF